MGKLDKHVLFSGGAFGVDTAMGIYALKYGITKDRQFHFRPKENPNVSKQLKDVGISASLLNDEQMHECYQFMFQCLDGKTKTKYKRSFGDDLKARNYYQIKNAMAVYAVAELTSDFKNVHGGTRYGISYAKYLNKLIYVFDYTKGAWFVWADDGFVIHQNGVPILFERFAGIGSRKIQKYQIKDKNTGQWIDNPDYAGDDIKNISLKAIKQLFQMAIK